MPTSSSPELLAPAGNWDCVRAALAHGADAVYFGLDQFNARMRADNFTLEDLSTLMPFLHSRGARGYVTMNVLIFPSELEEAARYLDALNAAAVDGVIVQDLGLAQLIADQRKAGRWSLELHISTQMTVSSPESVQWVDEQFDPQQIVLSRELSVDQIKACAAATTKPIEVFCHGALCVAYSGQCLTSESLGQRSANRGECAQACRLPYTLIVDGQPRHMGEKRYLFSPQDLCAIDRIPQMLEAGVASFKIEGRLKSPEYVAATVRAYRKAIDAALGRSRQTPAEKEEELYAMQMAFSRGFSTGWLDETNHPRLTHGKFGKKRGALAGRIAGIGRGFIELDARPALPVAPGDGFVIDAGEDRNEEQGGRIWKVEEGGRRLFFHGKASHIDWQRVKRGQLLWKTADPALDKALHASWVNFARHAEQNKPESGKLNIFFTGHAGEPLRATCRGVMVESEQELQLAQTRPLTPATIEAQFGRLGGTEFTLGACNYKLDSGLMLPVSQLNHMRRALLEQVPAEAPEYALAPRVAARPLPAEALQADWPEAHAAKGNELRVLCREPEQAYALAEEVGIACLYLDLDEPQQLPGTVARLRQLAPSLKVYAVTMRILKPRETGYFKFIRDAKVDGLLIRNLGAARELRHLGLPMVMDFSLNTANPLSAQLWRDWNSKVEAASISYDLNAQQVSELLQSGCAPFMELTLHQHMPLFHMEHCAFCTFLSEGKNFKDCQHPCRHHRVRVLDRTGAQHYLRADEGCRNTLFNGQAQTAARYVGIFRRLGLARYRIELLEESPDEALKLVRLYRRLIAGQDSVDTILDELHAIDRIGITEGSLHK